MVVVIVEVVEACAIGKEHVEGVERESVVAGMKCTGWGT